MRKLINLFTSKEFLKFLATGGFAAGVNFFSRIFLSRYLDFSISVVIAYLVGMITAFILSKLLVFQTEQKGKGTTKQFLYFSLVNVLAVVQTLIVSVGLNDYILPAIQWDIYPEEISHFVGISIPIFSSYLGHKYLTFSVKESSGG